MLGLITHHACASTAISLSPRQFQSRSDPEFKQKQKQVLYSHTQSRSEQDSKPLSPDVDKKNSVCILAYFEWRAAAPGLAPLRLPRART